MDKPPPGNNAIGVEVRDQTRTPEDTVDPAAKGEDEADNSLTTN